VKGGEHTECSRFNVGNCNDQLSAANKFLGGYESKLNKNLVHEPYARFPIDLRNIRTRMKINS
jgi:hypothetical protein